MDAQKVLEIAESNKAWIIRCKDEFDSKAVARMLYINFRWLLDLLSHKELDKVDPIQVKIYKGNHGKVIDDTKTYAKLTYRGKDYYLADDDYGQCMTLYIDGKWMGLGTYNFCYMDDAKYLIRSKYFESAE